MASNALSEMCVHMEGWLLQSWVASAQSLPPDDLTAHVSGCARCRGVLLIMLADLVAPKHGLADTTCELIEDQIPAFLDYEHIHSPAAAARAFPNVWWHTIVCPGCDDLYRTLQELVEIPAPPWVARLVEVPPPAGFLARLQIHADLVRQLLGLGRHLGVSWGQQQDDMVIAEQQEGQSLIQVLLRREQPNEVALIVRTRPPIDGTCVLSLENTQVRAALDAQGCTIFGSLSDEQLNGTAGVGLTLTIEPPAVFP
jgi:hypothetical protein